MRQDTRDMLQSMESWPLFEHVGEPIISPQVLAVKSWSDAVNPDLVRAWNSLRLQVNNNNFANVNRIDWHRFQLWNPTIIEVKQALEPLFGRVRELGNRLSLPDKSFYHHVTWDLVAICMETEHSDILQPFFSAPVLAPWYQAGHFPCGWDQPPLEMRWNGELPPCRLYVY